ncbi:DNA-binding domain-containing protein [uncultured Tenacibaculum sp.]|uniref:DNA-binding domain-containing protein n=1 Tax=uncultured Tenacibaculum sp. TaxID=174713 RepID=UPI00262460DA|nr:DNA-binding domain-containing protein [uncultured Tenacibaculum sp.]
MKYYLTENKLTDESNYVARVLVERTIDQETLITNMLRKRNLVSKTDIVAVLNSLYEEVIQSIIDGYNITLPIANIGYSITGVFDTKREFFIVDKHKLHINLNGGKLIKDLAGNIVLKRVKKPTASTEITDVMDISSETLNTDLTSEGIFELNGSRLKIAGEHADIGLYFVAEDATETKVAHLAVNSHNKIIAQAPTLAPGNYLIRIKSQATANNGVYLKELRITDTLFSLTVA